MTAALAPKTDSAPPAVHQAKAHGRWRPWFGLFPVAVVAVVAVIGPWVAPHPPGAIVGPPSQAPSGRFWLGTDSSGFDVASRLLAAARTDVEIAVAATIMSSAVGVAIGVLLGWYESSRGLSGIVAHGGSRLLDLVQAVPALILALVALAFFGGSVATTMVVLAVVLFPFQARLVRTEVLKVRKDAYLDAARLAGLSEPSLLFRSVLPNSVRPAVQNGPVVFGSTIILTAALGFLGVGMPPSVPEWGTMISTGVSDVALGKWWPAGFPAAALCFTVVAMSVAGRCVSGWRSSVGDGYGAFRQVVRTVRGSRDG